ncbi:cellulose binding domain-containing protein [Chitinophaga filiformis]|uniref:Por secretion system C-terminal sorting domain-containing protein n=1 Tax=Chitinophaga filiformis TaxID=104663 RepID=A0A1G7S7F1_CHIFI|nr:cellulose binding domain-containing protein [Chitinophaga filiformis]SDG18911.1 Por secretion system C-terminal sorting domain-containing protein [Chitinophaga filiformis]
MKTIITIMKTLLLLCLTVSIRTANAQQFVHPGIPFTMSDLDQLKQNITREPWLSAYNSFKSDSRSQLSYGMQGPFTTVSRAPDINRNQWINDMTAIHNLAFMWIFTGDTAYAKKATDILNAWAVTQTTWTGDESFLDLGDQANLFVTGADILKSTYPGWTATNTANVNRYFSTVIWPQLDVPNPVRGLNQGAIQLKAAVSIAAFLDDPVKWNAAIQSYRADAGGGLANSLPNGQVGDAGRDEGHWRGQGEALAWSAEVAWKQGIDLFADLDNRLLAISELYSHFHTDTTGFRFIPFGGTYGFFTGWGSNGTAKQLFRMYNIIEAAYTLRKGIPAPYSVAMRDRLGENAATFLYRKSADASTATALPPIAHPATTAVTNLTNADVGATGLAGSAVYNNGSWTVKGAGADIPVPVLQSKDAFNFAFQRVSGNVAIVARVTSMDNTDVAAKAGIMFRESLNDDARFTGLFMQPNNRIASTWRGAVAWSKTNISWNNPPGGYLDHFVAGRPYWLKLEKIGSRITAYHSFDSISWTCLSAVEIPMTEPAYVGLCVSSHNTSVLNTTVFDGVAITNISPAGSPVISSATADTAVLGTAFSYAVTASPAATSFSAAGLPAGLTIDSATGIISGTPGATGTFPVTLNAANNIGGGSAVLMLKVVSNVPPAAPGSPALAQETDSTIRISWSPSADATSYTVKHALTAGGPYTSIVSGVTGTSYVDATAYPGHNYYIITASAGSMEGAASTEVTLQLPPTIPSVPAVENASGKVILSWSAARGADTYNVKRSAVRGGPYTTIASGLTVTQYTDSAITNGSYYYYVISSFATPLESANSTEVLGVPSGVSTSWGSTATTGNWSNGANWTSGTVPESPALLSFNTSTIDTLNNDIDQLEIASMLFNAGADAFVINGDSILLGNDITNNASKAQVINLPMQINRTVVISATAGDISLSGPIAGTGGIVKNGRATLNLAGNNTFTGGLTLNGTNAGGWPPNTATALTGVGTGTIGAPLSGPAGTGPVVMNGGALMNNNTAVLFNDIIIKDSVKSYLYSNGGGLTFAGRMLGSGTIEHDGASTSGLQLNGDNREFTGTFISVNRSSNHRIRFNVATAGSAKANWIFNNGFTDGQGFTFTDTIRFGAMSGGGQLRRDNGAPVISIGALNTNTTFFGIITGALTIVKEGTGILRFTGANNYSGNTTVTGGTLLIDSTGQITSTTNVVAGTIGGVGKCTGTVTVGTGAIIAPGSQGIGKFTIGSLTLQQGATYLAELNTASGDGDQLSVSGIVLNNPRLTITGTGAGSLPQGTSYTIVDNTGTAAVSGIFDSLPEMSLLTVNGLNFRITYKGGTGNDIVLLDDRSVTSVITSPDSAAVIIGKPFSYTVTAIKSPGVFHATGLPAGLQIDTARGVISGTPEVAGVFAVQLSATGATGTGTSTLTLTVYSNIVNGLMVASGDKRDIVEWNAIQNLRYLVKRATAPDGPFTSLDTVVGTKYTDTAVTNGNTYYYTISSVDAGKVNPASDPVTATPNVGQYGYWKFDEQGGTRARDVWGANHAALASTAKRDTGYAASALKLDGTANAYASLPAGTLSTLNDFTITLWVKMDAITTWMRIFDFGNGTNNYLFLTPQAGVTSGKSIVRYAIKNGGGEQQVNYNYTFPLNTWTHFAITQSGNTCRLYINGTLVATNTGVTIKPAALGSTAQNYLGKSQFTADPNLKAKVDEFRIYNRAQTAAEIAAGMKAMQEITFAAIPGKRIGDADFKVTATASSGLPVSFSSADVTLAKVTDSTISILQPGADTIIATQPGDSIYAPATAKQVLHVLPFNLQVQHMDGDTQTAGTNIKPYLKVINTDTVAALYKELTARYWFTAENFAGINTWIDYAAMGNSKVKMKYVVLDTPRNGAFGYVEYSFDTTAGKLAAGANSGAIQSRIANKNSALLQETNDYSYAPNRSYTANDHITLYRNGKLVWGIEPATVMPVVDLKIATQAVPNAQNQINTYVRINNDGNVPVNYEDLSVRYWFTAEDSASALNYWIDYAVLGAQNITGAFVRLNPALDSVDAYFEVKVKAVAGKLYPLSNSGNIQYRIAKANWSNFNQANDYSYQAGVLSLNAHATLYYKGQLIWGTEPVALSGAARQAVAAVGKAMTPLSSGVTLYPNPVVNELRVKVQEPLQNAWITVLSNSGTVMCVQRMTNAQQTVSFSSMPAGVYYVTIRNNGRETTKIIVKE